jgi:DMSO/TMAO reductase YedYZ molybdopterin-dependent catalytic subunit
MDEPRADRNDEVRQDAGQAEPVPDGPEGGSEPPMRTSMRYSRKRLLILGGAFLAGLVGVAAGLKALGGSAASTVSSVGDAVKDRFGPFPVRSVDGIDETPLSQWTVKVDGLVDTPLTVDYSTWSSLARLNETVDFNCVEGWTVADVRWGGVAPSVLLDKAGVQSDATYVTVYAESGKYFSTLPLDLMRDPQTVLADTLGGEPLPYDHGGPLRLVVPKQLGYKNVKWVSRLEVTDKPRAGYWERYGYPEDAPVVG